MRVHVVRVGIGVSCRSLWGCESCIHEIWRDLHLWPRFKVHSPRETLLQDIAVVARWSGLWNRQFRMYQRMVSNVQAAGKHEMSKTETGPKTSNYLEIKGPRNREAYRWSDWKPKHLNIITVKSKAMHPFDLCLFAHARPITNWLICGL